MRARQTAVRFPYNTISSFIPGPRAALLLGCTGSLEPTNLPSHSGFCSLAGKVPENSGRSVARALMLGPSPVEPCSGEGLQSWRP